jgi:ribonuclease HI
MQLSLPTEKTNLKQVTITTDGACQPNPGRGGWAAILRYGSAVREISGGSLFTTNNRMELTAIVEALRLLKEPCQVQMRTDSKNAIAWCSARAFRSEKKRRKLREAFALVQLYRQLAERHEVTFLWVRGHNGDVDNERADHLAQDMCRRPF